MLSLTNPPIIEAIVDINCDMPPSMNLVTFLEPAKEALRDTYPNDRRQMVQSHELRAEAEKPPEMSFRQHVGALQFLAQDGKQIIQIRAEGFSFNRLAPYVGLDECFPEIERTWTIFRELTRPVLVRRIGLRFINRILIPAEGPIPWSSPTGFESVPVFRTRACSSSAS